MEDSASSRGKEWFERGKRRWKEGDYAEAEMCFSEALKCDPRQIWALLYIGHSRFRQKKYLEAIPAYEWTMKIDPSFKILDLTHARILTDNLGTAYGITGQLKKAKDLFEKAVKKDRTYPMYYYNLACAFAELGDITKAIANIELAVKFKSNLLPNERLPNPLSDSSFQKCLGDPRFVRIVRALDFTSDGVINAFGGGRPVPTQRKLAKMLRQALKKRKRYYRTGNVKDLQKAIHLCKEALAMMPDQDPDRSKVKVALGLMLLALHERTRRLEELDTAISLH